MSFHIIIPARYQSSRLPGKVLLDIGGRSMLEHVYLRAQESGPESIVIATDDARVQRVAEGFGANVYVTEGEHQSGTERIAEVVNRLEYDKEDVLVGLQADEPFIPPSIIKQLAAELEEREHVKVASLCHEITDRAQIFNPHVVKVVLNHRRNALYFSRAPIPWDREHFSFTAAGSGTVGLYYRHIGVYAYRAQFLSEYLEMDVCDLERIECLEQLRVLWHGGRIHMVLVKEMLPPGVDTQEDLVAAREFYSRNI